MKQVLFLALLLISSLSLNAQTDKAPIPIQTETDKKAEMVKQAQQIQKAEQTDLMEKSNAVMTFESLTVDYGTIAQNSEPLRVVKFTNTGTDPLLIKNARGSCGCTVPNWPKEPVLPGQSSVIEVRYDTNRVGKINKSITITTNEGSDSHILQVVGEILKSEEQEGVPSSTPTIIKGN
ncbi:MAG: DUF1573 domain-containing protein [Saprospiraceae bacterium]|nr:DUF1573 domain-containing protein [Saprospiraceae bacterium]